MLSGPAIPRIEESPISELVLLNTIPAPADYTGSRIKWLDVSHMFAEAIEFIYEEVSISSLF